MEGLGVNANLTEIWLRHEDWIAAARQLRAAKPTFNMKTPDNGHKFLEGRAIAVDIKEMVKGNKQVTFMHYRDGDLWYRHEEGFEFPVPIADVGTATMLASDKAMLFMRYIRKHAAMLEQGKAES